MYTPTLLDTRLLPDLLAGPPTLVVLSGNAGDGKTAFISEVIRQSEIATSRGRTCTTSSYWTVFTRTSWCIDGSEDADQRRTTSCSKKALRHFRGPVEVTSPPRGTLIAINKGRLLQFLDAHKSDNGPGGGYGFLWDAVRGAFLGGRPTDSGYILIDLNERTVVGPGRGALMDGVLDKLLSWSGWGRLRSLRRIGSCPALFNVRLLRDGDEATVRARRDRVWSLFAATDLDDRLHVTARHVTSELGAADHGRPPMPRRSCQRPRGPPLRRVHLPLQRRLCWAPGRRGVRQHGDGTVAGNIRPKREGRPAPRPGPDNEHVARADSNR